LIGTSHERWDEGGAVAVAFHALAEDTAGDPLDALRSDAGARFDPAVVDALAATCSPLAVS
jgi:hypothetical protein